MNMKALIIENEYKVDGLVEAFIFDNPTLFEEVDEELYCTNRKIEGLLPSIMKCDAIVIASTWLNEDQVEQYLKHLVILCQHKKITFYLSRISKQLNEWLSSDYSFQRNEEVSELAKQLFELADIYEIYEDYDSNYFEDDIQIGFGSKRHLVKYSQVKYNKETNTYYL